MKKPPLSPALLAKLREHDPLEPLPDRFVLPECCTPRSRKLVDDTTIPGILGRIPVKYAPRNPNGRPRRLSWRRPWTFGGLAEIVGHLLRKTEILKGKKAEADRQKSQLYIPSIKEAEGMYLADPDVVGMGSHRQRKAHIKLIVKHVGGAMLVTSLTGHDLQSLLKSEHARGLSKASLTRLKAAMSSFLRFLSEANKITESERLELLKAVKVPKSAKTDKRSRELITPEEFWHLVECAKVPLRDRALYVVAYAYGERASDAAALRWRHVDTDEWRRLTVIRPKTDARPVLHVLHPEAASILREWFMASGRPDPNRPVFGRIRQGKAKDAIPGSPMTDSSSAARRLRRHLKAAGIKRSELHDDVEADGENPGSKRADFHSFRRLAATDLARRGVPTKDAMEIMGWTTPAMYARYQQAAKVQDQSALPKRPEPTPDAPPAQRGSHETRRP